MRRFIQNAQAAGAVLDADAPAEISDNFYNWEVAG